MYFAVSVASQQWILARSIDVENPTQQLASGPFAASASTWYNLILNVTGSAASAWIEDEQVAFSVVLPSVEPGWAAIGSSVQSGRIYTLAQFDNFSVQGKQLQCAPPVAGDQVSSNIWCGGQAFVCIVSLQFTNTIMQSLIKQTHSGW